MVWNDCLVAPARQLYDLEVEAGGTPYGGLIVKGWPFEQVERLARWWSADGADAKHPAPYLELDQKIKGALTAAGTSHIGADCAWNRMMTFMELRHFLTHSEPVSTFPGKPHERVALRTSGGRLRKLAINLPQMCQPNPLPGGVDNGIIVAQLSHSCAEAAVKACCAVARLTYERLGVIGGLPHDHDPYLARTR